MTKLLTKILLLIPIFFVCGCSSIYLFETPFSQAKQENNIEELNNNLEKSLSQSVDAKELKGFEKYVKNDKICLIDLLDIAHSILMDKYETYLKKYKNDSSKNIELYDSMNDFLNMDFDPIAASYNNNGNHKYVFDAFRTKNKIGIFGFYGSIENLDSYRKYAKENIKGAAEYENLREKYFKEVFLLKEEIIKKWKLIDSTRIAKDLGRKICKKNVFISYLIGFESPNIECIYQIDYAENNYDFYLKKLEDLGSGYIIGLGGPTISGSRDVFLYKSGKKESEQKFIYYAGSHSHRVLINIDGSEILGVKRLDAFKQIDMSKYPWISK